MPRMGLSLCCLLGGVAVGLLGVVGDCARTPVRVWFLVVPGLCCFFVLIVCWLLRGLVGGCVF
jgi:hypothetical protein